MQESVEFEVEGVKLRGRLYRPIANPKNIAIMFVHGWTGLPNEDAAGYLANMGFTAMTFSLSGHNDSEGTIGGQTRKRSLAEALAGYDFLAAKAPGQKIVLIGNSYGAYISILVSVERPVAGLSLRVPANYPDEDFENPQVLGQGHDNLNVMNWRLAKLLPGETKSLRALNKYTGPVQIIESERDAIIPRQTVQNYVDAVRDKDKLDYHFMIGWEHSIGLNQEHQEQFHEVLLPWLNEKI